MNYGFDNKKKKVTVLHYVIEPIKGNFFVQKEQMYLFSPFLIYTKIKNC